MSDTQIKICGLSTPEGIDAAVDAGATHVGLVHYAPSPRHVTLEQGAKLRMRVPQSVKVVLLLVNEQPQPTIAALQAIRPDVLQFHGSEAPEGLAMLKQHAPFEIWKAVGLRDAEGLQKVQRYKDAVHRIIYDAPAQALPGGNGLAIDWSLLSGFQHQIPWGLAGGLTADNIAQAIRDTGAPLVDTSTGVESAPGVKDADKIKAFCQAARGA
jgi:phosphoribosylanthranilate isomerase